MLEDQCPYISVYPAEQSSHTNGTKGREEHIASNTSEHISKKNKILNLKIEVLHQVQNYKGFSLGHNSYPHLPALTHPLIACCQMLIGSASL